ncbi:MAG: alpha/beta hydrolase [Caldilineaceae bacterium]
MPYTTTNQLAIYYEVHGQSGSPLLMIMGWGASIADWLPEQIDQLSQKHQMIVFDNRGAGRSI